MKVVVAGHLCLDLSPTLRSDASTVPGTLLEVGPLRARLGGSVANTGRALTRLGIDAVAAASVGDDDLARLILDLLPAERIAASGVRAQTGGSTSYSVVIEPPGTDRTFWHHSGANDAFDGAEVDVTSADVLHVGYPSLLGRLRADDGAALVRLFDRARDAGVTTSLDLAVVDPSSDAGATDWESFLDNVLPVTDVVSPSTDDLHSIAALSDRPAPAMDAEAYAEMLIGRGAAVAMVSAGPEGMYLAVADADRIARAGTSLRRLGHWAQARARAEAVVPKRFVSTNGAGDAASAGLIAGILRGYETAGAAAAAARAAADSIAGRDASPTMMSGAQA